MNKLLDHRDRGLGRVFLYKVASMFQLHDGCIRELGLELSDAEAWVARLVLHPNGQHDGLLFDGGYSLRRADFKQFGPPK